MRPLFHINDVHIGAIRTAGTTPATAYQLRLDLIEGFGSLLEMATGCDLIINGDLFDKENVPMSDLYAAYSLLRTWMLANPPSYLIMPPGNHDLSKTSTVFTSFDLLVKLLESEFGARVFSMRTGVGFAGSWIIPHVPNQDLFNLELAKVPPGTKYLFLHCNVDNGFAVEADHSLNLSLEQAEKLPVERIIVAHVHQRAEYLHGKVLLPGNQVPSSVADCLGNDRKYALKLHADKVEYVETCRMSDCFLRVDWRALDGADTDIAFVRVEGECEAHETSEAVKAISQKRKTSPALVITNSVKIEGMDDQKQIKTNLEEIKSFKVLDALQEILTEEERAILVPLMEENNV
jgi:DNA repair exonuclease SbcCD nuclease subunit